MGVKEIEITNRGLTFNQHHAIISLTKQKEMLGMRINGIKVTGEEFAYDGCHKMYVIEDEEDKQKAHAFGYEDEDILPIEELERTYRDSCDLRFIHNWKLNKTYADQFEEAEFR